MKKKPKVCLVCNGTDRVQNHHIIPRCRKETNDDTIPLCGFHHRMMDPFIHSVNSPFYPLAEAERTCRILNEKVLEYKFQVVIGSYGWLRKGKLIPFKYKQYHVEGIPR